MKVIACYSMKGGVGKTATSVNIAYWAAKSGIKTLLIDLDPQGASSFYFKVKSSDKNWGKRFFGAYKNLIRQIKASDYENLDIIPAHLSFRDFDTLLETLGKRKSRLKRILKGLGKEYRLIILDCPPSISNLSESIFRASDVIFVPVIPTTLSERTFDQLNIFFKRYNYERKRLIPFFSMVQMQKALHKKTMNAMRIRYKKFMRTCIPFSIDVENMGEHQAPVDIYARTRPANKAYFSLWKEMVSLIRKA